jgi:hypothetical protein
MQDIHSQEEWVLHRLTQFYRNSGNIKRIHDIISGNSNISLRLIDWFVTNYAKKFNIGYMTTSNRYVVVYLSYKSHLKAYSKRMFDPFCRWKRIKFHDFETTVGQLNFFEWAITDQVLEYIETHTIEIQEDMEECLHKIKNSKINGKKRNELSRSATNSLKYHQTKIVVNFE